MYLRHLTRKQKKISIVGLKMIRYVKMELLKNKKKQVKNKIKISKNSKNKDRLQMSPLLI